MTNFLMLSSIFIFSCLNSSIKELSLPNNAGKLVPGESTLLKFTEEGNLQRQSLILNFNEPGDYTLTFSNGNPETSKHWLIWDCINLKNGNRYVWRIGEDETPPDYSELAFDEFCDSADCDQVFIVGKSSTNRFAKEVNDHSIKEVKIEFKINKKDLNKDLTLEMSTLYSTHAGVDDFKMNILLK